MINVTTGQPENEYSTMAKLVRNLSSRRLNSWVVTMRVREFILIYASIVMF